LCLPHGVCDNCAQLHRRQSVTVNETHEFRFTPHASQMRPRPCVSYTPRNSRFLLLLAPKKPASLQTEIRRAPATAPRFTRTACSRASLRTFASTADDAVQLPPTGRHGHLRVDHALAARLHEAAVPTHLHHDTERRLERGWSSRGELVDVAARLALGRATRASGRRLDVSRPDGARRLLQDARRHAHGYAGVPNRVVVSNS